MLSAVDACLTDLRRPRFANSRTVHFTDLRHSRFADLCRPRFTGLRRSRFVGLSQARRVFARFSPSRCGWTFVNYSHLFCLLLLCVCAPLTAQAQERIQHIKSNHSVETTIERAERIAAYHGLRVLGIVDYAELAAKWLAPKKQALQPTRLLVFIDDRGGLARALQGNRLLALEMPLKILVWKDDNGGVWVSYRQLGANASDYQPPISPSLLAKLDELTRKFAEEAAR